MACALGIEQNCSECRMCDRGKGSKKITNYEKIKGMSVEELAEFLVSVMDAYYMPCRWVGEKCNHIEYIDGGKGCSDCFEEWLESEAKHDKP